jgi:hypothetical protein
LDAAILDRLAALGIHLLTEARNHSMFGRDQFIALVENRAGGAANIGSTGVFTEEGLAYLVWREERAYLAAKGSEVPADDSTVRALRAFSRDLEAALNG